MKVINISVLNPYKSVIVYNRKCPVIWHLKEDLTVLFYNGIAWESMAVNCCVNLSTANQSVGIKAECDK